MPPSRANYQQRAGRAGRRGGAVASVVAFGGSDTHDDHYFRNAPEMISGEVIDPILVMDNTDICRRHVTAFLLQQYHLERLRVVTPEHKNRQLFEVLGTVEQFTGHEALLNRDDFEQWLRARESELRTQVDSWVPHELSPEGRRRLLDDLVTATLDSIDHALKQGDRGVAPPQSRHKPQAPPCVNDDVQGEDGAELPPPPQQQLHFARFRVISPTTEYVALCDGS
jgi:hypothetical protein